jgi:hypothetical protein
MNVNEKLHISVSPLDSLKGAGEYTRCREAFIYGISSKVESAYFFVLQYE